MKRVKGAQQYRDRVQSPHENIVIERDQPNTVEQQLDIGATTESFPTRIGFEPAPGFRENTRKQYGGVDIDRRSSRSSSISRIRSSNFIIAYRRGGNGARSAFAGVSQP
jgi:hypothetical protein